MTATLVVNADMGNYSAFLGSAQMLPNGNLAFTSGVSGQYQPAGQSIEVLPNGTRIYVQQMSGFEYRSYFESTLYGTPANLLDPGFRRPDPGDGHVGLPVRIRPARRGPSAARPAWRATAAPSPRATPTPRRAAQVAFLQEDGHDQPGR